MMKIKIQEREKQGSGSEEGRKGDKYLNNKYLTYPELYPRRYNSKTGPFWEESDSPERKIGSGHQTFGHWRNNVERPGQTASTPIQHCEHSREQKKC